MRDSLCHCMNLSTSALLGGDEGNEGRLQMRDACVCPAMDVAGSYTELLHHGFSVIGHEGDEVSFGRDARHLRRSLGPDRTPEGPCLYRKIGAAVLEIALEAGRWPVGRSGQQGRGCESVAGDAVILEPRFRPGNALDELQPPPSSLALSSLICKPFAGRHGSHESNEGDEGTTGSLQQVCLADSRVCLHQEVAVSHLPELECVCETSENTWECLWQMVRILISVVVHEHPRKASMLTGHEGNESDEGNLHCASGETFVDGSAS